jgi:predicted regulator of Ras-like GTPase activity (Roadblock/LC7/MglB family)
MRTLLEEVLRRLPGALGAAVVGLDGVPVEQVTAGEDFNIELASAEGIGVVRRANASQIAPSDDPLEELVLSRGPHLTILRSLGPDYYLCLVVGSSAIPGQARFEAWRAGHRLREAVR